MEDKGRVRQEREKAQQMWRSIMISGIDQLLVNGNIPQIGLLDRRGTAL